MKIKFITFLLLILFSSFCKSDTIWDDPNDITQIKKSDSLWDTPETSDSEKKIMEDDNKEIPLNENSKESSQPLSKIDTFKVQSDILQNVRKLNNENISEEEKEKLIDNMFNNINDQLQIQQLPESQRNEYSNSLDMQKRIISDLIKERSAQRTNRIKRKKEKKQQINS